MRLLLHVSPAMAHPRLTPAQGARAAAEWREGGVEGEEEETVEAKATAKPGGEGAAAAPSSVGIKLPSRVRGRREQ